MKADTDETTVLSFDNLQNMPLPNIPVQEIFYMRQLWVFTFCTHNFNNDRAKLYIYHEGHGRRSPDKVCTFLFDFMRTLLTPIVKNLFLFSYPCGGQMKNHTLIRFLRNLSDDKVFENFANYFPIIFTNRSRLWKH